MHKASITGWALAVSSALSILPFLLLCFYWHPVGTHAVDWVSNWGGLYDEMSWWGQQVDWYRTTMGRFTSTALLSTTHYWYSLAAARAVILGLHSLLGAAVYFCIASFFASGKRSRTIITLSILALYLSQLSNPYDSLYRLSGLFIYQTGLIATLVFAGLLCRDKIWPAVIVIVLAVGTNETSLVQCAALLTGLLVYRSGLFARWDVRALLIATAAAAAVALLAPGNWVRAEYYQEGSRSLISSAGLVVATGAFTWIGWLSSTTLIPLLVIGSSELPRISLDRRGQLFVALAALLFPLLSIAPVLLATRGESFPEGIADWQIIPVALLLSVLAASLPRYRLSRPQLLFLVVFVCLASVFGGLSINRERTVEAGNGADRIVLTAPPGRAWRQLITGSSSAYGKAVEAQYAEVRRCSTDTCWVSPLPLLIDNYLYDPSYDRRLRSSGDGSFGSLVERPGVLVRNRDRN